ncbi:MAG: sulfotransferase domain-containing protein, partial [Thermomicrobiales bacterium]|nr:sulfotransferase domain-containing protein [Thermomicrobiales bacterium]
SFEEALAAEPVRLAGLEARLTNGELAASDAHKRFSYAARGQYAAQLARWLAVFPCEQLLILRSEDLYADPAVVTRQVTDFLGLPPLTGVPFAAHNATSGPPMLPETRIRLNNAFAPYNEQLARLLGRDPGWE